MLVLRSTEKKKKSIHVPYHFKIHLSMLQGNIGNPLLLLIYFLQKQTKNCLQLNSTLPL